MAKTIVIFPGGFHPLHLGHMSVYRHLLEKFPQADVYVASSDSTKERPFPFTDKKALAVAAGIPDDKFVKVKAPYAAEEITSDYDPTEDHLIYALSAKDAERISFKPKKDGSPSYFQKWSPGKKMEPLEDHAYIYIAPVKPFAIMGKEITSASQIRKMYSSGDDAKKTSIIKALYPKGDLKKIKSIFDSALTEGDIPWFFEETSMFKEDSDLYNKVLNLKSENKDIEKQIIDFSHKDPQLAAEYAYMYADQLGRAWKEGEKIISVNPMFSYYYAHDVLDDEFPEGEKAISQDAEAAYLYAKDVLGKRFPAGEKEIFHNTKYATLYKKHFGISDIVDKELKDKSEKSGLSLGLLKKIYNRGIEKSFGRSNQRQFAMDYVDKFIEKTKAKGQTIDVDKVEEDRHLPKRYTSDLSKSTSSKRKVFWKKLGKYPFTKSEYEKAQHAPGDSKETHTSKYTKAYKEKYGESLEESVALDKALKGKAEKSGISVGILRKVYNRGMAAWVTGHRPGASQAAWGMARVNSFITKGKTWHTADADLAKRVRKEEEEVVEHIVKTPKGYVLYSKSKPRRKLGGPYPSRDAAVKRERQVQYFKHMGEETISKKKYSEFYEEYIAEVGSTEDIGYPGGGGETYEDAYVHPHNHPHHPTHLDPKGDQQMLLEDHPVPEKVKDAAREGIEMLKDFDSYDNPVRRVPPAAIQMARDILKQDTFTLPKVKAVWNYLFRHKTKVQTGEAGHRPSSKTIPSDEWIAWQLYGGTAGKDWADGILHPKKTPAGSEINTQEE